MSRFILCPCVAALLSCSAFAQAFDVADVHVSPPSMFQQMSGSGLHAGRYELRTATMVDLIKTAYGVDADRVSGGPSWLGSTRFDVLAKAPAGANSETAKTMLQALLAERFGLVVHNDNKPVSVYVLTVAKNGPKMKQASGSDARCDDGPNNTPLLGSVICRNVSAKDLAETLHDMAPGYIDRPIVDQTKLEGSWDFELAWTARGQLASAGADGVSYFDAVDKKLGLKLELQKIAMPVIVVDRVNEKPTDNLPGVGKDIPAPATEFEVAAIKPADPSQQGVNARFQAGGRIDIQGSLRDLIAIAWNIPPNVIADRLVGAPKFIETDHFNIVAKAPDASGPDSTPSIPTLQLMLRNLIIERFKMQVHEEERPATIYALTVPKGEPKIKKADPSERVGCKNDPSAVPTSVTTPTIAQRCINTTMADLAESLPQWAPAYADHPVVDATGLTGGYDFVVYWTPRGALQARPNDPNQPPGSAVGAADPGGYTLFEAVDKELGLKLEVLKGKIKVMVIDHIEQTPQ